jgi:hypothetical protein
MERLLQTFDTPFTDRDGDVYIVELYGNSRPGDTWQGSLVFARPGSGERLATGAETTQPSADALLYWASGLSATYFEGAFERAQRSRQEPSTIEPVPPPLRDVTADDETYRRRLTELQRRVLDAFARRATTRLAMPVLLADLPHAHADVIRAIEDMEKRRRILERRTEGGSDWLLLTREGARAAGVRSESGPAARESRDQR